MLVKLGRIVAAMLLMFVVLSLSPRGAQAQAFAGLPQFSADTQTSTNGAVVMSGKLYFGGKKVRVDVNGAGHSNEMIMDMATQTTYMVMPQQKIYMEISSAGQGYGRGPRMSDLKAYDPNNPCAGQQGMTCKKLGTETVNGRTCDKWEFSGEHGSRIAWIDQKLHFPVKTVEGDTVVEMKNIKEGSQEASLFEIPSGYQKMDMGNMMRGQRPN